ncbi:MAG: acyltransferase [Nevskia sp.]|nr:acyltransferase [Nevskia sp.]
MKPVSNDGLEATATYPSQAPARPVAAGAARAAGSARIGEIEGVRGVLSLIVLGGHVFIAGGATDYQQPLFWYGGCMEVFFCISGFLITRILLSNAGRPGFLKNYFVRRVLRIWPMYYFAMLLTLLIYLFSNGMTAMGEYHPWHPTLYEALNPVFYLQNLELYLGRPRLDYLFIFNHSWSVAVEEQFYLMWPFVTLFLLRRAPAVLRLALAAAAILLSMVLRSKMLHLGTFAYWLLGTRLDGFILGAFLAYLERAALEGRAAALWLGRSLRWLWLWPCFGLLPFLSLGYLGRDWHLPGLLNKTLFDPTFNFAGLGFCLIGYCLFHGSAAQRNGPLVRLLNLKPLAYLGTISYSTYLLHVPIIFAVVPILLDAYHLSGLWPFVISYGLTLSLAHFSFNFIEAQAMRLKKRFAYAGGPRRPAVD